MIDHDQIERTSQRFDPPEDAFERFTDRRHRRQRNRRIGSAVVALVVAVGGIGFAIGALRQSPDAASRPRPPGVLVLVAPLCGHPPYQATLPPPFNGSGSCPHTTPAGRYASALVGVSEAQPFTFTLPSGWQVNEIPEDNGMDLRKRGSDVGISILVYPRMRDTASLPGPKVLATAVSRRPYVVSSSPARVQLSGHPAWQVDVRPRDDAPQQVDCRVGTICVPLVRLAWGAGGLARGGSATGVALLPQTTSRLIFLGGHGGLVIGVWVWNVGSGPGGGIDPEVQRIVDSLHFERACC